MQSFCKKTLIACMLISTLALGSVLMFSHLFNPKKFQQKLFHSIEHSTGYHVETHQKVTWSFFPWLGVDLHQLKLHANEKNHPDIRIAHTHIIIASSPLFTGTIRPKAITLRGVQVQLHHGKISITPILNWTQQTLKKWPEYFAHLNLEITEGTLLKPDHQPWIDHWTLHANNISKKTPFTLSTILDSDKNKLRLHISSLIQQKNNVLLLKNTHIKLNDTHKEDQRTPLRLSANIQLHPQHRSVSIHDLIMDSASLHLQGQFHIQDWQHLTRTWHGELSIPTTDLITFLHTQHLFPMLSRFDDLSSFKAQLKLEPGLLKVHGQINHQNFENRWIFAQHQMQAHFDQLNLTPLIPENEAPSTPSTNPAPFLLDWHYHLTIDHGQILNTPFSNLNLQLQCRDHHLLISPLHLGTLGGTMDGQANLSQRHPFKHAIQLTFNHIQPLEVLRHFKLPIKVTSTLHATVSLNTEGTLPQTWLSNLSGYGNLSLSPGTISGLNWPLWYQTIPHLNIKPSMADQTLHLTKLQSTFTLNQSQLNTDHIDLSGKPIQATGSGIVDLSKGQINYNLKVRNHHFHSEKPIEFKFFGDIKAPTVLPNLHQAQHQLRRMHIHG